jgi:hypothetical protein
MSIEGRLAIAIAVGVVLVASACVDASRVNAVCAWSDSVASPLDLGRRADREHLRQDAQVAWELAVRYGDATNRHPAESGYPLRRACRSALDDSIATRHHVPAATAREAALWRLWWADVVTVFLPMLMVVAVFTNRAVWFLRGTPPLVRRALPVIVALLLTGLTNYWAMTVETLRLRNEHLADRVTALPTASHAFLTFTGLFVVCLIVARTTVRRGSASR